VKYIFTLKGAIWWKSEVMHPFDWSNVVYINRDIDANDAGEAIRAAKRIVKDLREENPSRDHNDYGVKAELFLGTPGQPLWEYRFAKGKVRKEYWEKKAAKADNPRDTSFYSVAIRTFTEPPEPPKQIFKKGGVIRHPFPGRRIGGRAG
jgi:hypothetical protein